MAKQKPGGPGLNAAVLAFLGSLRGPGEEVRATSSCNWQQKGLIGNGGPANALKAKSSVDGECNTSVNDRSIYRQFLHSSNPCHPGEPDNVGDRTIGPKIPGIRHSRGGRRVL